VNGSEKLSSLYHCFLTIIANVSPYCKTLSLVSSVKLVNLFELFCSPRCVMAMCIPELSRYGKQFLYSNRFLCAAESNHLLVALLLEVLANIIQYQVGP